MRRRKPLLLRHTRNTLTFVDMPDVRTLLDVFEGADMNSLHGSNNIAFLTYIL